MNVQLGHRIRERHLNWKKGVSVTSHTAKKKSYAFERFAVGPAGDCKLSKSSVRESSTLAGVLESADRGLAPAVSPLATDAMTEKLAGGIPSKKNVPI